MSLSTSKQHIWEWYDDSKWVAYAKEQQDILEKGHQEKKTKMLMTLYGNNYTIHFNTMKQENMSSHYQRSIQRREKIIKGIFDVDQRFVTNLSVDKVLYKLEDIIYVRAILLSPNTQQPLSKEFFSKTDFYLGSTMQIIGPKGDIISENQILMWKDSILSGTWKIPSSCTGGKYRVKIIYKGNGIPPAEREFEIRAFQNPRLNSQIEFIRKGYGVGDKASATLNVTRAEGGVAEDANVKITARVDGNEIYSSTGKLDKKGNLFISFDLPKTMTEGDGTLICVIDDKGVIETATKTIPILMNNINVQMYPEGGDLVYGLECGLYVEATTKSGEPADLFANIVDQDNKMVSVIVTSHEGRGKTTFTPKSGQSYSLQVIKPTGIKNIPLPKIKQDGVSLRSKSNVFECDEALLFKLSATKAGKYNVSIFKREIELSSVNIKLDKDFDDTIAQLTLPTKVHADGVLRVLIKDTNSTPVAERLIFRKQTKSIKINMKHDYKSYAPGDKVKLRLQTTDQNDEPVQAIVCVTITDESVFQSVEKRKHHPRLDTMMYLESEVDHLEDATVYLSNEPLAALATDLLLGTQGWRRFAYVDPIKFLHGKMDKAERALCVHVGDEKPSGYFENPNYVESLNTSLGKGRGGKKIVQSDFENQEEILDQIEPSRDKFDFDDDESRCSPIQQSLAPPSTTRLKSVESAPKSKIGGIIDGFFGMKKSVSAPYKVEKMEEKKTIGQKEMAPSMNSTISKPSKRSIVEKESITRRSEIVPEFEESMEPPSPPSNDGLFDMSVLLYDSKPVVSLSNPTPLGYVREYAHKIIPTRKQGDRVDFAETLFWNAGIQTNKEGRAVLEFDMSDSITSFRAFADAFTETGIIGVQSSVLICKEPFYLEPKVPLEVSSGDHVVVPISLSNSSQNDLDKVVLTPFIGSKLIKLTNSKSQTTSVKSEDKARLFVEFDVENGYDKPSLTLEGKASEYYDKVSRSFSVVPSGFPTCLSFGGLMSGGEPIKFSFNIPDSLVPESLSSKLSFYTSSMSNLGSSLGSLLEKPHGCFEQTSSTTYPTIMAYNYFMTRRDVNTSLIRKSYNLIEEGYKRLITFECKDGGFEWFADGSGHEGLTALAVLEFTDMSKIYPVDSNLLSRTLKWLLARRDGKGGWVPNNAKSYQFGGSAPEHVKYAYICWALSEAGISKEIALETEIVHADNIKRNDAYCNALAALTLYNLGQTKAATEMAERLVKMTQSNGSLTCGTTICGSYGISKEVETTCLAILTWLHDYNKYTSQIEKAIQWLHRQSQSGYFGSTQGTILALRALVAYERVNKTVNRTGSAKVVIDDKHEYNIDIHESNDEISLADFAKHLTVGDHTLYVEVSKGCTIPYAFSTKFNTKTPNSSNQCMVDLNVELSHTKFKEGDGGEINVTLSNLTKEKLGMTMAIVGLPGGVEPRHDQLKEMIKSGTFDLYEIDGRNIVIYKRGMDIEQVCKFKIDVIARIPGHYQGPASRAYLYYGDEHKKWVKGLECLIE